MRLDDAHGCAFHLWDKWQAPDLPRSDQFSAMRAAAEVAVSVAQQQVVGPDGLALELTVLLPSVTLIVVEPAGGEAPGRPVRLRAEPQPGLSERENILLTWTAGAHVGMQTFDVLSARSPGASFERVNPSPLLSAAFLHAREPGRVPLRDRGEEPRRLRTDPVRPDRSLISMARNGSKGRGCDAGHGRR